MKIAYDHQIFSLQRHGGISRYFVELLQNLVDLDDVEPTAIVPIHINEYLLKSSVRDRAHGLFFPFTFRGNARVVRALNSVLLPFAWPRRKFDVIHETYYSTSQRGRCRLRVLTIYDMIHELFPAEFPDSKEVTEAKRAAISRADHVICISETTRQDAIRLLGLTPERSSVIYLASSLSLNGAQALADKRRPYVLYVGNRNEYKNFRVLLRAVSSSGRLKHEFDVIAFGGRGFTSEERSDIRKAGLTTQVRHVTGGDNLLGAYYKGAVAFVYPSRYEGFGIPPLEAMTAGCPVACSNAGSISEVVGDAGAYFEPDDSEELRCILERLADDKEYAAVLRTKGFARVGMFSWKKCALETLSTYKCRL